MAENLTLTLPITEQGATVLLLALAIAVLSGLVWLMLGQTETTEKDEDRPARLLTAVGWVMAPVWFLLLAGTLYALWDGFNGTPSLGGGTGGSLGLGAVIVAFLSSPFLIWTTILKHRTVGFQKEGHLTDRISKAVEQLGAEKTVKVPKDNGDGSVERTVPNIEVRIGGILSLERIAQDSCAYDKGRDHVRVMEILCAYIRENAPASGAKNSLRQMYDKQTENTRDFPGLTDEEFCLRHSLSLTELDEALSIATLKNWAADLPKPRADITVALRVIGRRDSKQRLVEARWGKDAAKDAEWVFDQPFPNAPFVSYGERIDIGKFDVFNDALMDWITLTKVYLGYRLDLRETNLQAADLSNLCFSGALMQGCAMEGCDMSGLRIQATSLDRARLDGASLHHVLADCSDLWGAGLEGVGGLRARLNGADLSGARMTGAIFVGAEFGKASLDGAQLRDTHLVYSMMVGAQMHKVNLEEATFSNAYLDRANLKGATVKDTDFNDASVVQTDFASTDLTNSKNLTAEQLISAYGNSETILPGGLGPDNPAWPTHWPKTKRGYWYVS